MEFNPIIARILVIIASALGIVQGLITMIGGTATSYDNTTGVRFLLFIRLILEETNLAHAILITKAQVLLVFTQIALIV